MPPSESIPEIVSDVLPVTPYPIEDRSQPVDPNGHGNGRLDGSLDQHKLLNALQAMRLGDFSVRLPGDLTGLTGKIADTFNDIVATNQRMAQQLERVGQVVGREGRTRQRVRLGLSDGAWGEMESSVNSLIDDLLWPTTEVTRAIAEIGRAHV